MTHRLNPDRGKIGRILGPESVDLYPISDPHLYLPGSYQVHLEGTSGLFPNGRGVRTLIVYLNLWKPYF